MATLQSPGSTAVNQTAKLWTNTGNIFAEDGAYATCPAGAYQEILDPPHFILPTLYVSGFDFSAIPADATVTSVRVSRLLVGKGSEGVADMTVALTADGTTNLCLCSITPSSTMTNMAASVQWSVPALSISQVKSAGFGVRMYPSSLVRATQNVDVVALEVGYTTPQSPSSPVFLSSVFDPVDYAQQVF